MKRTLAPALFAVLAVLPLSAALSLRTAYAGDPARPPLHVTADGFPSGNSTPEGVACDLARAFIHPDVARFRAACLPPYGPADYERFLKMVLTGLKKEAAGTPSPSGPKAITHVYAARPLSKSGPASYGYTMFDFRDVRFVDIQVTARSGKTYVNRTLVVQDAKGQWHAHAAPQTDQLLSAGLNEESPSMRDIATAYRLVRN